MQLDKVIIEPQRHRLHGDTQRISALILCEPLCNPCLRGKFFNLLIFILTAVSAFTVNAEDALKTYRESNIAYQKQDYATSIIKYEQLIKSNNVSPEVYYNLGNTYFKSGNFSRAIINYERALKLEPDDEDAIFNLKIAQLKVVDKIETVPQIFYKRWINSISTMIPANTWSIILIVMIWMFFAACALYVSGRTVLLKKLSFVLILIFILFTGASFVMASRSHSIANIDKQAIIMSASVYIKSSPDEKGNDVFILHEGTKVDVLDQLNNWQKIRIANGSIGWMKSEDLEII